MKYGDENFANEFNIADNSNIPDVTLYVKSVDDLKNYNKVLCGHSWGGYSTINVLPFVLKEDNVKLSEIVTISLLT